MSVPPLSDPEWPVRESTAEYRTGWYTGGYDLVELPDGREKRYYWAELPAAVVVVALADGPVSYGPDGPRVAAGEPHVLFVEQYRPTVRETQFELVAGIVEEGESFEEAATRELEEETGFAAASTTTLQTFWCATGVLRHRRAHVFAADLTPVGRELDANEFLTPRAIPASEALDLAREPPTNDATVEGLLLAAADDLL